MNFSLGRGGTNAGEIAKVAQLYGLDVRAFLASTKQLEQIELPAIAYWRKNHFVVVEKYVSNKIMVVDPAIGRIELSQDEFSKDFSNIIMTFLPNDNFQSRKTNHWAKYLIALFDAPSTKKLLGHILFASMMLQLFGFGGPLLTKLLLDFALPLQGGGVMVPLIIGVFSFVIIQGIMRYLREALLIHLRAQLNSQMTMGLYGHLLNLPLSFFQHRSNGDLLTRLGSATLIRDVLMGQVLSILLDGITGIIFLIVLFSLAPLFGWITLIIGCVQIVMLIGTTPAIHLLTQRDLLAQADTQSFLVESLTGIKLLKALGREEIAFQQWVELFLSELGISIQRDFMTLVVGTIVSAIRILSPLGLTWLGIDFVLQGKISLGTAFALISLSNSLLAPLSSIIMSGQIFQFIGAYIDRIVDIVDARPEENLENPTNREKLQGQIELKNVYFQYDANRNVLSNISIKVNAGEKIAIVGSTGAGKSTLAMLLLGLHIPNSGEIYYDNIPISEINLRWLRNQFGVVLQEPFIFNSSIRKNIAFSNPDLPIEKIIEAANNAVIHEEIVSMPTGYDTIVGEGGSGLSGGQRQRIAIAQALVNQPAILLLDEATSYLDSVTESLVEQNLKKYGCTQIVIAHRLSTVQSANQIIVLNEGQIIERGTHNELLAKKGCYFGLVQEQLLK